MDRQKIKGHYSYGRALGTYALYKKKEKKFKMPLNCGKLYVIRFDGSGMTKGFKIKHKAINETFFETMRLTFENFAKKYPQVIFGYSFSDEISILFKATNNDIFSRGSKLLSLMSGQLALEFYKAAQIIGLDCKGQDWIFDARLIELERTEVVGYFKARQAFAIDKFLSQCKSEYGLNKKLKTSSEIIAELKQKEVDYNSFNPEYRYGLIYSQYGLKTSFEFLGNEERLKELYLNNANKAETAA